MQPGRPLVPNGGAVAQLGARLDGIEEAVGSNPIGSTKSLFHALLCVHPAKRKRRSVLRWSDRALGRTHSIPSIKLLEIPQKPWAMEASSPRGVWDAERSDAPGKLHQEAKRSRIHRGPGERVPVKPERPWVRIPSAPPINSLALYLLWRERSEVRRDRDNVVFGKILNHFFHRCHGGAGARSILYADELPCDIDRLQPRESGHVTLAP